MFKLINENKLSNARTGILKTAHGKIETPFFMPVATRSSGKFIGIDDYNEMKIEILISNALINFFKPGLNIFSKINGIHKFMNYKGIVFTDSGGFQMSRSFFEKTSKRGVWFRNPFNQQKHLITPKKSMEIQYVIGSDVAMVLDYMPPIYSDYETTKKSLELTHRWAKEALISHEKIKKEKTINSYKNNNNKQLLFAISQGALHPELRKYSAEFLSNMNVEGIGFDGIAIGGLAIGEKQKEMLPMIEAAISKIPKDKIRYLMGVGNPSDILEAVERGIDCFDSIYPTRNARHGTLFTFKGKIDLMSGKYKEDFTPIEKNCDCLSCKTYSKAYIHHLLKIKEPIGKKYVQIHNIYFMLKFMKKIRESIKKNEFQKFKSEFLNNWNRK